MSPTQQWQQWQRLVLDTNTVMAVWHFADPRLAALARHLADPRCVLVTRDDALEELRHVLAYRQFGIAPARQQELLAHYTARCIRLEPPASEAEAGAADDTQDTQDTNIAPLPLCRDADDQKFLEIARDGAVACLVSRDRMLLRLNRHRLVRPLFRIMSPEQLCAELMRTPAPASEH